MILYVLYGSHLLSSLFCRVLLSMFAINLMQYHFYSNSNETSHRTTITKRNSLFPLTSAPVQPVYMTNSVQSNHTSNSGTSRMKDGQPDPYQYIHDDFRRHKCKIHKFVTTDTMYEPVVYDLKENILWNHHSVCNNRTFLLMMYFVNRKDLERRQFIRQYVKQGMVVDGKVINYVMVVALDENDDKARKNLTEENTKYQDLLISVHKDTYVNVTLTVLDAFLWVRDYCKEPSFVARIDADTWVHMGNLVHFLRHVPQHRFYGGYPYHAILQKRSTSEYPGYVPEDYPEKKCYCNAGGAYILSRDLVPYFNIGTLYVDIIIRAAEDALLGEILSMVGIYPYRNFGRYLVYTNYEWLSQRKVPPNVIFVHNLKEMALMKSVYTTFATTYTTPYRLSLLSKF